MGEVYRARDTKLGREVAIKVLPVEFSQDKERLARFEREAKLLASLNHTNIATLFGFEESEGQQFLVMEFVDGRTLASLIAEGPLPIEEALQLFEQIAEALESAHEKGVVHRDLKPANIMITSEGKPKVLDFGLAKAFGPQFTESTQTESPTITRERTEMGVILGTAAYMSPEQARGRSVDRRTDVWSFGCVIYEMLTGRRAFLGGDVTETLAAVVRDEPDWSALPTGTPASLRRLLRRCLEKDRHHRLQHAGDARLEIREAMSPVTRERVDSVAAQGSRPSTLAAVAVAAATLTGVGVWIAARSLGPETSASVTRLSVSFPVEHELLTRRAFPSIALSPDGTHFAYVAESEGIYRLYLRAMDRFEAMRIPDTEGVHSPVFSPDGQWVAFFGPGGDLLKVPVTGGTPQFIAEATTTITAPGVSWGDDDSIVFSSGTGLLQVPASGGTPQPLTTPDARGGESAHAWPQHLPGSEIIVFSVRLPEGRRIAVLTRDTATWKVLDELGESEQARYLPSGHIVFVQAGGIWAVAFDPRRSEVRGTPTRVIDDLRRRSVGGISLSELDISSSGTLLYRPSVETAARSSVVEVGRDGRALTILDADPGVDFIDPHISPDGRHLALVAGSDNDNHIWVHDLSRGTRTRLTTEGGFHMMPLWAPNGERIAFGSVRSTNLHDLYWKPADGTRRTDPILPPGRYPRLPTSWSADGKLLAFYEIHPETKRDIWIVPLTSERGERELQVVVNTPFEEVGAQFSPDGRWIVYVSDESGRNEIYVQPLSRDGRRSVISIDGGIEPVWSPTGSEIFYRSLDGRRLMAAKVETDPVFSAETPRVLFEGVYENTGGTFFANYSVSSDGERFYMIQKVEEAPSRLHVVLNWFEELNRLIATDN